MGINHVIVSTMLLIGDGLKSKLIYHFIFTVLYFLMWYIVHHQIVDPAIVERLIRVDWRWVFAAAPPALLAIHYWYMSFVHLNPFKKLEHNVFDL